MVLVVGNEERRFELRLQTDKFGSGNEIRTHKVKIENEVWLKCECTCNKPNLIHFPCSHVLAACRMLQLDPMSFVSPYYLKEVMLNTWIGEMWGFQAIGNFNRVNPAEGGTSLTQV
jgi:hypothetical protein